MTEKNPSKTDKKQDKDQIRNKAMEKENKNPTDNFKKSITYGFKLKEFVSGILEINANPLNSNKKDKIRPKKP